jgi:hypothetical protein
MSTESRRLLRRMAEFNDANDHLRDVLLHNKRALVAGAKHIENGEWTADEVEAGAPEIRFELTEALSVFEKARHEVRLSFFGFGTEQGKSMSEIGRALGVSRQLASRLAAEAKQAGYL